MDNKLTEKIQTWLSQPVAERNITEGANMLLQLNRNKVLYRNIIAKGNRLMGKLEYELKKYLKLRIDGQTVAEVVHLERELMPAVESLVKKNDASDQTQVGDEKETDEGLHSGKRADHEELPPDIQQLWESNFDLFVTIKQLFEELKAMNDLKPCDRYDKLQLLKAADEKYRSNLAWYDAYKIGENEQNEVEDPAVLANKINSARKYLSDNKGKLSTHIEAGNEDKATALRNKMQERISLITSAGGAFTEEQQSELVALGLTFD